MKEFIGVGVDLGKNYFQVHALESEDGGATTRKLSRQAMRKLFSETRPCLVGMEPCGSAHYWARELQAMGHEMRLIPPICVKPCVKRGNNDDADVDAIEPRRCRGEPMRFVPVKSAESQATLMLHKTRELLIKQRTMGVNSLRGYLSEFGMIGAKGIGRLERVPIKWNHGVPHKTASPWGGNFPEAAAFIGRLHRRVASAPKCQSGVPERRRRRLGT